MPLPHSAKLPRPKSEDEFEDMVLDALRLRWSCEPSRNGRRGQTQNGVDIFGKPAHLTGAYAGAQCKNTDSVDLHLVLSEAEKARSFRPPLREFVFVTSAPADSLLQEDVREFFVEHPPPFDVSVMFWEDVCAMLTREQALVRKYWPSWIAEP